MKTRSIAVSLLLGLISTPVLAHPEQEARIAALEAKLAAVSNVTVNGQPTVRFSGVNVQIVNGTGATNTNNGRGNLILGYDLARNDGKYFCSIGPAATSGDCSVAGGLWAVSHKTGSHYLVVGDSNNYSQYGGVVVGTSNTSNRAYASVSGGWHNTASGHYSSVSGGYGNTASGSDSSVSGGGNNTASNYYSSVSGGYLNTASGYASGVSGGYLNTASGSDSSVSGGRSNTASGIVSSVSGGVYNTASDFYSSVSGGAYNTAGNNYSSVSGGWNRSTIGYYDWVAGGLFQDY